jgi:hypothetical protein
MPARKRAGFPTLLPHMSARCKARLFILFWVLFPYQADSGIGDSRGLGHSLRLRHDGRRSWRPFRPSRSTEHRAGWRMKRSWAIAAPSYRSASALKTRLAWRALDAPESELAALSRGRAYVRTLRDGQPTVARPMEVESATLGTGRLAAVIANTHANFSRPRKLAEKRDAPQRRDWH